MAQLKDNYQYTYISTTTTTQVATGAGQLIRIIVGTTAAGSILIIDNTSGSTPLIGTIVASIPEKSIEFGINFANGLRITTAANSLITVVWSSFT